MSDTGSILYSLSGSGVQVCMYGRECRHPGHLILCVCVCLVRSFHHHLQTSHQCSISTTTTSCVLFRWICFQFKPTDPTHLCHQFAYCSTRPLTISFSIKLGKQFSQINESRTLLPTGITEIASESIELYDQHGSRLLDLFWIILKSYLIDLNPKQKKYCLTIHGKNHRSNLCAFSLIVIISNWSSLL